MSNSTQKKDFEFFIQNQSELVKKYEGLFLVIKDQVVKGAHKTLEIAYLEATKQYEEGSFLIQHCLPGESAYTQTFHTRAVFN